MMIKGFGRAFLSR